MLIAVDLDGTLLRNGERVNADDLAALHDARRMGIPVVIATGRAHYSTQPVVDKLGLDSPYISYNGAWITAPDGTLMRDLRIPVTLAKEVLRGCRDLGLAVRVFLPDEVVMNQEPGPDETYFKYRAFERVDPGVVDTLSEPPMRMIIVHIEEVSAFASEYAGTRFESEMHWLIEGRDPETPHLWTLHLLPHGGTKSAALAQLCEQWGIPPSRVLAFGDGPNDVDMLAWAGTGVSFPWAIPDAQAAADVISTTDDPHPIATHVNKWLEAM